MVRLRLFRQVLIPILSTSELRDLLERTLELKFAEHESLYLGVYYRSGGLRGEHVIVQANEPDDEGDLPEPDFEVFRTLVEINESERADELRIRLGDLDGLTFLRRTTGD